jgi:hypothetical protein
MPIRRSYHFNTTNAARKDGIYMNDPCDLHFRVFGDYSGAPYGIDSDGYKVLGIGDRPLYKPNSASLPIHFIGGQHVRVRHISAEATADVDDFCIVCELTSNYILHLPLIATLPQDNKVFWIKGTEAGNACAITPSGTDVIDNYSSWNLFSKDGLLLVADRTPANDTWWVIAQYT